MITLQIFVFDKTHHLVLRDSTLVHPESAPSFDSCFPTVPLNRTKLKYGTMKLKTYEKFIWMIEPGAIYPLRVKGCFLVHPESAHWVYHRSHILW